jgi:hypothetical protein
MTEANVRELQDQALGQYTRLKQNLVAAKARMEKTGKEMYRVGAELESYRVRDWAGFSFSSFPWLNQEFLNGLAQDIVTAEHEVQQAKSKAASLGVALSE